MFDGVGARKDAKKVLVVFTDKSSGAEESALRGQNGIVKPGDHLVEVQCGVKLLVLKLAG